MKMKRIISMICVFALVLAINVMPTNSHAAAAKYAYLTVEKLTIGQGFVVKPIKVELKDNDTVKDVFKRVAETQKVELDDGTSEFGWFLTGIKNADNGNTTIPEQIQKMPSYESSYEYDGQKYTTQYTPPKSTDKNDKAPDLVAYSYNSMAGWMFASNNKGLAAGADAVKAADGDVIRVQFSLYGWGADIGIGDESYTGIPNAKLANKDALIKKLADVAEDKDFMNIAAAKKVYDDGIKTLEKYDATQVEVDSALSGIKKYEAPSPEVKVGKASIKKIKNIKGKKAKITVKKMKGVTGYVFKYSKYKSFKKSTKKDTKKTTIKTKKFKKKQTCYAKVRAYKKVGGNKVFGKWSKVKKVKIRK